MLFLSDFDGDPSEYLAAFGIAVASGMRWSFGSAAGFPGPRPTRRLVAYVREHSVDELVRYTAYPDATVRDIDQAVEVTERLDALLGAGTSGNGRNQRKTVARHQDLVRALARPPRPVQASFLAGVWSYLWERPTVGGLAVAVPITPGSRAEVASALRQLNQEPDLFDRIGGVHFARLAILPLPGRGEPALDHLLFSAWFDGDPDDFVERLVDGVGPQADTIWGRCPDYPGSADPDRLASWILDRRLPFSLFLHARSGRSVEEIRAALILYEQVSKVVIATAGQPAAQVRRELARLGGSPAG